MDDAKQETDLAEQPAKEPKKKRADEPKFLVEFARSELDMIKNMFSKTATAEQFAFFIYDCQKRGLNPLKKEMHLVMRNSKMPDGTYQLMPSHQVAIDGYRKMAERTCLYEGQTKVEYSDNIIDMHGVKIPEWAEVGIYKKTFKVPLYGRVYAEEFVATNEYKGKIGVIGLWKTKPRHMLAKCAEALAFRKAFPDDCAGLYIKEELDAGIDVTDDITVTEVPEGEHLHGESSGSTAEIQKPKKSFDLNQETIKPEVEPTIEGVDPQTGWEQTIEERTPDQIEKKLEETQKEDELPMF